MGPYRTHLEVLPIDDPCAERWSKMEGTDSVRFCRVCESHVYDLSEMTTGEAHALLEVTEGRICVRFYRRADGTIATKDCAPDRAAYGRRRRRRGVLAGMAAMAVAGAVGPLASALPAPPPTRSATPCRGPRPPAPTRNPSWIDPEDLPPLPTAPPPHEGQPLRSYTMGGASPADVRRHLPEPRATVELGSPRITGLE